MAQHVAESQAGRVMSAPSLIAHLAQKAIEAERLPLKHASRAIRIETLGDIVSGWSRPIGQAYTAARTAEGKAKIDQLVDRVIAACLEADDELWRLVRPSAGPGIPRAAVADGIAVTAAAIAKARGGCLLSIDALFALAWQHAPDDASKVIGHLSDMKLSGWLRQDDFQELLAKRGIVTFYHEPDRQHRLINVNWLPTHGQIWNHVMSPRPKGGKRCRFCRIEETEKGAVLLIAQASTERHSIAQDAHGRRTDLRAASGYVHQKCLPHWNKWLSLVKQYPTPEAAFEADLKAERMTITPPPPDERPPEPEAPEVREYYGLNEPPALPTEAVRSYRQRNADLKARRKERQ